MTPRFSVPAINRQVFVAGYLDKFRQGHMKEALSRACREVSPTELRRELLEYAPEEGLKQLTGTSIRDEDVFATPLLLKHSPGLLAYYRMMLGISQKRFYSNGTGLSKFRHLEEKQEVPPPLAESLPELCRALNERACELVLALNERRLRDDVEYLPLLTFGAQADGAWRNTIGTSATSKVYGAIKAIVAETGAVLREEEGAFAFENKSSRTVTVSFSADPDVVVREWAGSRPITKAAIEIKGGRDRANVHNRAGEAEKSHQKAKGSTGECWTVMDLSLSPLERLREESPSTKYWFDLRGIELRRGPEWACFRDHVRVTFGI